MVRIEIPRAVVEQVMNHLMSESNISQYFVHEDERRVAEVPADMGMQAVSGNNDNEWGRGSLNSGAGRDGASPNLKGAGCGGGRCWLTEFHPVPPLSVEGPSVAVVGRGGVFISPATTRQNDKKH